MYKKMMIHCLNIGPYQVNTYIVGCPETRQGFIIDPGGEPEKIIATLSELNVRPLFILNTHGHRDHVPANRSIVDHFHIPIGMHHADVEFFKKQLAFTADKTMLDNYKADIILHHNDRLEAGALNIHVIHTPGHTPGSACFLVEDCLFSGDTLFVGNAGRTDLPGGDLNTLIHSIHSRLAVLPDNTILYPGHDYGTTPTSTMGREKKENLYITDFI